MNKRGFLGEVRGESSDVANTESDKEDGRTTNSQLRVRSREPTDGVLPAAVTDSRSEKPHKTWPTPTARDWKDSGKAVINSDRNLLPQKVATRSDKEKWVKGGGALNPTWVEWLMGYPSRVDRLKSLGNSLVSRKSPTTSDNQSSRRWPTPSSTDGQRGDVKNLEGWRR